MSYNKVFKCDLESIYGKYKNQLLLVEDKIQNNQFDIDLTGDLYFNCDYNTKRAKEIASVNCIEDIKKVLIEQGRTDHCINVDNRIFGENKEYLLISLDYILNNQLQVVGTMEENEIVVAKEMGITVYLQDIYKIYNWHLFDSMLLIKNAEKLGKFLIECYFEQANEEDFDQTFAEFLQNYKTNEQDYKLIEEIKKGDF